MPNVPQFRQSFLIIYSAILLLNSCIKSSVQAESALIGGNSASIIIDSLVNVESREVSDYYGGGRGPTKKFYFFERQKIVLSVRADYQSKALIIGASLDVFEIDTPIASIKKWARNQYSDGISLDAAKSKRTILVNPKLLRYKKKGSPELQKERLDKYYRHEIDFTIDPFSDGDVTIKKLRGSLEVFQRIN